MPLELKNLSNGSVVKVPDAGVTFGREGGNADVQFKDGSVSKRHARVFSEEGAWILEDLGSSNGTFHNQRRLTEAVELSPGDVFAMSKIRFEVLASEGQVGEGAGDGDDDSEPEPTPPPPEPRERASTPAPQAGARSSRAGAKDAAKEPTSAAKKPGAVAAKAGPSTSEARGKPTRTSTGVKEAQPPPKQVAALDDAAGGADAGDDEAASEAASSRADEDADEAERDADEDSEAQRVTGAREPQDAEAVDEAPKRSVGYFFVAVPKAIAYYIPAVLALAFTFPFGGVKKAIEAQKRDPMGPMELIAYALPAYMFSAAVGFLAQVVVQLVQLIRGGSLQLGALVGGLIGPQIGAVIASVVVGLVWHPVLGWVVTKLKGESTPRSRTNFFLMVMAATILVAIPNGAASALLAVPFRLVAALGPLLAAVGAGVTVFVTYSWLAHFGVLKWFRLGVLGLGLLGALFTAWGGVSILLHGAPGSVPTVTVPGSEGGAAMSPEDAQRLAEEAAKAAAAAGGGPEAVAAMEAAAKAAAAAAGAAGASDAAKALAAAQEAAAKAAAAAAAGGAAAGSDAAKALAAAQEAAAKSAAAAAAAAAAAGKAPSVPFAAYARMRDGIDAKLKADPTLLKRTEGLLELYKAYEASAYAVQKKWSGRRPEETRTSELLREAELYEATAEQVKAIHDALAK